MQPFTDRLSKAPVSGFQTPLQDAVGSGLARSMLDASPDCIKLISLDGDLVYMNHNGMCAMEIDNFCDVENKSWPSLWPEEGQDLLKDAQILSFTFQGSLHALAPPVCLFTYLPVFAP